jgi:hypothetical protein
MLQINATNKTEFGKKVISLGSVAISFFWNK